MPYETNQDVASDSSIALDPRGAQATRDLQRSAPVHAVRLGALTARLVGSSGEPVPDFHLDEVRVFAPASLARASLGAAGELEAVRAPAVCIVPPGQRLELRVDPGSDAALLALDPLACEERGIRVHGRPARVAAVRACEDAALREVAESLARDLREGRAVDAEDDPRCDAVALHLVSVYGAAEPVSSCAGLSRPRLERVLAMVNERLTEALPVADLAEAVHLSPFHFSRMFRVSTGRSPHEWIMLKRMARAKTLLARTRMPLPDVAKASGYRTHSHFSGMFHAVVGVTPGQYRLRHA